MAHSEDLFRHSGELSDVNSESQSLIPPKTPVKRSKADRSNGSGATPSKRSRQQKDNSRNEKQYTDEQCDVIAKYMVNYAHILENANSSQKQKREVYDLMVHALKPLREETPTYNSVSRKCRNMRSWVNRRTSKKELSKTGGGPPSVLTKNWEKEIYKHCKVNVKGTGIPGIDEPAVYSDEELVENDESRARRKSQEVARQIQVATDFLTDSATEQDEADNAINKVTNELQRATICEVKQVASREVLQHVIKRLPDGGKVFQSDRSDGRIFLVTANTNADTEVVEEQFENGLEVLGMQDDNDSDVTVDESNPDDVRRSQRVSKPKHDTLYVSNDHWDMSGSSSLDQETQISKDSIARTSSEKRSSDGGKINVDASHYNQEGHVTIEVTPTVVQTVLDHIDLIPKDLPQKLINILSQSDNKKKEGNEIYKVIGFNRLNKNCVLMRQIVTSQTPVRQKFFGRLQLIDGNYEIRGCVLNFLFQKLANYIIDTPIWKKLISTIQKDKPLSEWHEAIHYNDIDADGVFRKHNTLERDALHQNNEKQKANNKTAAKTVTKQPASPIVGKSKIPVLDKSKSQKRPPQPIDKPYVTKIKPLTEQGAVNANSSQSSNVSNNDVDQERMDGEGENLIVHDPETGSGVRGQSVHKFWSTYQMRKKNTEYLQQEQARCAEQLQYIINQEVRMNTVHEKNKLELEMLREDKKRKSVQDSRDKAQYDADMAIKGLKKRLLELKILQMGGSLPQEHNSGGGDTQSVNSSSSVMQNTS